MHLLSWADNRTLIACQCLIAMLFSSVLLGMRRLYPHLRGLGSMAAGFALGLPVTILLALRDHLPLASIVVGSNVCGFFCYMLLYRGLILFCHQESRRSATPNRRFAGFTLGPHTAHFATLYVAGIVGTVSLAYYTAVQDRIVPRIVVTSLVLAFVRGLMARELNSHSAGRRPVRFFAWFLAVFSGLALLRAATTVVYGAPADFMRYDRIQTVSLVGSLLFICVVGLLCLAMVAGTVNKSITDQAEQDFLTGSLNRRGIEKALAVERSRCSRTGQSFAAILIDVDHFKQINDTRGHAAGDEALRAVVRSIDSVVRTYDKLGRLGGDEFLLLLPNTSSADALLIGARIRNVFDRAAFQHSQLGLEPSASHRVSNSLFLEPSVPTEPAGTGLHITLSVGVTLCLPEESSADILARVDTALYEAKRAGRDCARLQNALPFASSPSQFLERSPAL